MPSITISAEMAAEIEAIVARAKIAAAWNIGTTPPQAGYYIAAWRRGGGTEPTVSELWFNPTGGGGCKWWFSRGYIRDRDSRGGMADAVRGEVVAWMPMPEPPTK